MPFELRENSQPLRIALELLQVSSFQLARQSLADFRFLLKPMADCIFAGMPKWGIANIMCEARRLEDRSNVVRRHARRKPAFLVQSQSHSHPDAAADAGDL
jgi:hypothetical protein